MEDKVEQKVGNEVAPPIAIPDWLKRNWYWFAIGGVALWWLMKKRGQEANPEEEVEIYDEPTYEPLISETPKRMNPRRKSGKGRR